ncbi:hypothetical protein RRG08_049527 [Elysia crispata]|uniref:Uncharacterized protein n=1 Tax=Elysia crispata TaxID=231223 RepID=A0AAE1BDB0_9GAST|nr:hypothetical protein RRG08_049527 [Elysia crispata]
MELEQMTMRGQDPQDSGLRVKEFEEALCFYSEMIGKISDLKMNKKHDHKGQLDDEKEDYSDQTERKQKTRTHELSEMPSCSFSQKTQKNPGERL